VTIGYNPISNLKKFTTKNLFATHDSPKIGVFVAEGDDKIPPDIRHELTSTAIYSGM